MEGGTKGYRNHPQLERFRAREKPVGAINRYLRLVLDEAKTRGYRFDESKIDQPGKVARIDVTRGQVAHEFKHLLSKLLTRDPERYAELKDLYEIEPHPLFHVVEGNVADWERT